MAFRGSIRANDPTGDVVDRKEEATAAATRQTRLKKLAVPLPLLFVAPRSRPGKDPFQEKKKSPTYV